MILHCDGHCPFNNAGIVFCYELCPLAEVKEMNKEAIGNETPCRGCGRPIRFIKMRTGGNMPVEATPFKMVFVAGPQELPGGILADVYEPHWANCENAEDFKK